MHRFKIAVVVVAVMCAAVLEGFQCGGQDKEPGTKSAGAGKTHVALQNPPSSYWSSASLLAPNSIRVLVFPAQMALSTELNGGALVALMGSARTRCVLVKDPPAFLPIADTLAAQNPSTMRVDSGHSYVAVPLWRNDNLSWQYLVPDASITFVDNGINTPPTSTMACWSAASGAITFPSAIQITMLDNGQMFDSLSKPPRRDTSSHK